MTASSISFILFAIAAATLHALWANRAWRSTVFLVANGLFIASFTTSPMALMPVACFLAWGYVAVRSARFAPAGASSALFVAGTLLLFCWLKKYWFLSFVPFIPFPFLALGLSYAFFRIMGLIIDARSEPEIARIDPIDYFNFAVNFPTMIAGPIDRYQEFSKPSEPLSTPLLGKGFERIVLGFFKVLVVSAWLSPLQSHATAALLNDETTSRSVLHAMISFGLYPLYLYANFSGYTDIVIGTGNLFGKFYPENFNSPFLSVNFIEFWSRWHMTLSFWLRDYVYTPLLTALMRHSPSRSWDTYLGVVAYFVTFFLIGIWHGSTLIFAIYGLLLAIGVAANKLYQTYVIKSLGKRRYKSLAADGYYRFGTRGLTYTYYSFCMICFWSTGERASHIIQHLNMTGMLAAFGLLFATASVLLGIYAPLGSAWKTGMAHPGLTEFGPYLRAVGAGALVFCCFAMVILTNRVNADIIYQAF